MTKAIWTGDGQHAKAMMHGVSVTAWKMEPGSYSFSICLGLLTEYPVMVDGVCIPRYRTMKQAKAAADAWSINLIGGIKKLRRLYLGEWVTFAVEVDAKVAPVAVTVVVAPTEVETLRASNAALVKALREIYAGCKPSGRWLDCSGRAGECDGADDVDIVPEGYEAVDEDDRFEFEETEGTHCWWCAYTNEEQVEWVETCTGIAQRALTAAGAALVEPVDGEA